MVSINSGSIKNVNGICLDVLTLPKDEIKDKTGFEVSKIKKINNILLRGIFVNESIEYLKKFSIYNILDLGKAAEMMLAKEMLTKHFYLLSQKYTSCKNSNDLIESCFKTKQSKQKSKRIINYIEDSEFSSRYGFEIIEDLNCSSKTIDNLIKHNIIEVCIFDSFSHSQNFLENVVENNKTESLKGIDGNQSSVALNDEQKNAYKVISKNINSYKCSFIFGVTGSGKTEVYLKIIKDILTQDCDSQVLVMLPEITMASVILDNFEKRLDTKVLLWHSSVSNKDRLSAINFITNSKARVIVGVRSAIMLPYKNLKMIIVDEEHDQSYKQDEAPTYNARDMAVLRAKCGNFPVILISATPSVETYLNCVNKKYEIVRLRNRFLGASLPNVDILDVKDENLLKGKIIANKTVESINRVIQNNMQVMIFLNRRGYSRMLGCKNCKYVYECPNCDNKLTYHKTNNTLKCHYCSFFIKKPDTCEGCNKKMEVVYLGSVGLERVKEEVESRISGASIEMISSDNVKNPAVFKGIIDRISRNEVNIILATQIATKGFNFKNLELVVALEVDIDNVHSNLRIFERTYQILTQVAGRAGRFSKEGRVIIQTRNPNNPIIHAITSNIEDHFYKEELLRRKSGNLPPYSKQIAIICSSDDESHSQESIMLIFKSIRDLVDSSEAYKGVKVFGPIENIVRKLKRKYRYHILLQSNKMNTIASIVRKAVLPISQKIRNSNVKIDVNPQSVI